MPSVIQTMKVMPPWAASRMASAANLAHDDEGCTRARGVHRFLHRVEDRDTVDVAAALTRSDPADDLGAVVAIAQTMKATLTAGESLDDHLGVLIYENTHCSS